ncbi:hypothetical protein BN81_062 [Yersinia phage phiD1]|uniref:Uncharacterized protein n=2 Tax=Tequatrovirus TaxID=10663 RepID=I7J447_9CAUD|nr:hypothetical protein BN81_062 [Yersinia phage phiD1]CCI88953.1 protein of unknown function [Yersinia phage phiD1]
MQEKVSHIQEISLYQTPYKAKGPKPFIL